jgi:Amt family ammonium transporter
VAITPSCANISPLAALGLGFVAGAACAVFVDLKFKFGFDDSLDVVGVHLGGGLIGTLALGFIALPVDGAGGGLFYGGGLHQVIAQVVAVLITVAVSGLGTAVIGLAIHKTVGFRVSREDELAGVDRSEHAETAYAFAELGFSRFNPFGHHVRAAHAVHTAHAAYASTAAHAAGRAPETAPAPAKEDSLV